MLAFLSGVGGKDGIGTIHKIRSDLERQLVMALLDLIVEHAAAADVVQHQIGKAAVGAIEFKVGSVVNLVAFPIGKELESVRILRILAGHGAHIEVHRGFPISVGQLGHIIAVLEGIGNASGGIGLEIHYPGGDRSQIFILEIVPGAVVVNKLIGNISLVDGIIHLAAVKLAGLIRQNDAEIGLVNVVLAEIGLDAHQRIREAQLVALHPGNYLGIGINEVQAEVDLLGIIVRGFQIPEIDGNTAVAAGFHVINAAVVPEILQLLLIGTEVIVLVLLGGMVVGQQNIAAGHGNSRSRSVIDVLGLNLHGLVLGNDGLFGDNLGIDAGGNKIVHRNSGRTERIFLVKAQYKTPRSQRGIAVKFKFVIKSAAGGI